MAEYGDGEFQRLETNRLKQEEEESMIDFQNSKILTELEVFDELELRIFYDPKICKETIRYSIKDGVVIDLDLVNTFNSDYVYEVFADFQEFGDFIYQYFLPRYRDFETVYELLTKQEVISTLVRCKPAKYVFV